MKRTASLLALLTAATALSAQIYEQVAPQTPVAPGDPTKPKVSVEEPAAKTTPTAAEAATRLLPELKGLVFVTRTDSVKTGGVSSAGLDLTAVPLLNTPAFRAKITPYLGKPLTMGDLKQITREAVVALRDANRPVVDVAVPQQNIQTGTIQLVVLEGTLGQVRVEGNKWFSSEKLASQVRIAPGQPIAGSTLLDDLGWLNQNPFRRVDLVFAPGSGETQTDVILRVQDRRPVRVYAGYDNTGTPTTDENRVFAGVNWGDAFGRGDQLNYQLTASPDFQQMVAQSASYVALLPWRDTLTTFGSYSTSKPEVAPFNLEGTAWQVGTRYKIPLKTWLRLEHAVTVGFDFKRSDNDLAFGGSSVFAQATDVVQLTLAYSATRTDDYGATSGELSVALSPGGIGGRDSDSDYAATRAGAEARYAYVKLDLERVTKLPADFSWVTQAQAQLASTNLLGSEQLGFGGANSLRGYDEREVNGDGGAILVNELRAPGFGLVKYLGVDRVSDLLVPLVFVDAGVSLLHDPLPGEDRSTTLLSTGVGVRYSLSDHFTAKVDYGWQLKDSGVSPTGDNSRAHVSVTAAW